MTVTANDEAALLEIKLLSKLETWDLVQIERKMLIKGVIQGVHKRITNEEMTQAMTVASSITKAERIMKRINGRLEETTCVVITFEASTLPLSVYMAFTHYHVRLFNQAPTQCYNCRGFRHLARVCNREERCARCGSNHNTMECDRPRANFKCVNCEVPHSAAFDGCPKRKQEQQIIKITQDLNIPKAEARSKVRGNLTFPEMVVKTSGKNQETAPEAIRHTEKANLTRKDGEKPSDPSPTNQRNEDYYRGIEKELKGQKDAETTDRRNHGGRPDKENRTTERVGG